MGCNCGGSSTRRQQPSSVPARPHNPDGPQRRGSSYYSGPKNTRTAPPAKAPEAPAPPPVAPAAKAPAKAPARAKRPPAK